MKTTIEMADELFRKAKAIAALRGQSLKELITAAAGEAMTVRKPAIKGYMAKLEAFAQTNAAAWKTDKPQRMR